MKKNALIFSPENKMLLKLLSCGEKPEINTAEIKSVDLSVVVKTAKTHGVFLLAATELLKYKSAIPLKTYGNLICEMGTAANRNEAIYSAQQKLLSLFEGNVKCVILKGLSAAAYYDYPEKRIMGDIDVFVDEKDVPAAQELLLSIGYERLKGDDLYDILFSKNGVLVELHFSISGIPDGEYGKTLKSYTQSIVKTSVIREFKGQNFLSPDDAHNAVIMLLHIQHHLYYSWVFLKQFVDWAHFIEKTDGRPFWKDEVLPLLEKTGLKLFAAALTKACNVYLNSPLPEWAEFYGDDGADILDAIFASGEVSLSGKNYKNADVLTEGGYKKSNAVVSAFKYVHKKVTVKYPFIKKTIVPYPFLYVYESAVCFIKIAFCNRKDFKEINEFSKRRKKIHGKYKIFKNNKR